MKRIMAPITTNGMLWPGSARGLPSGPYLPEAGPEDDGAHQGRPASGGVHDGGAGEVRERVLQLGQPAAAPGPAQHDRVDDRRDGDGVDEVALELRALRHGPGHDRGRGRGERGLEEELGRDVEALGADAVDAVDAEAAPAEPAAEQLAVAVGDRVADQEERQDAGGGVHEVLHHDVADVLGPRHAGLEQREADLHEEHEDAGDEDPEVVEVDRRRDPLRYLLGGGGGGEGHHPHEAQRRSGEQLSVHGVPPWVGGARRGPGPLLTDR
jgi:hypothetical protein